ncbi:MAG: hypothetical protein MI757_08695 [Pirellulales bacterium]|nr:hypothetical protein [Pirellulales bacterium]
MPVTNADIRAFTEFALERVDDGQAESMRELFGQWLERREGQQVAEAVEKGEKEIADGGGKSVDRAIDDIRTSLGWSK